MGNTCRRGFDLVGPNGCCFPVYFSSIVEPENHTEATSRQRNLQDLNSAMDQTRSENATGEVVSFWSWGYSGRGWRTVGMGLGRHSGSWVVTGLCGTQSAMHTPATPPTATSPGSLKETLNLGSCVSTCPGTTSPGGHMCVSN